MWIPKKLYVFLPWICIGLATLALTMDAGLVRGICVAYLYLYAAVVLIKRWQWRCL